MGKKSPWRVLFSGILGILLFLILWVIINIVSANVGNSYLESIVVFLNANILYMLLISVILFFGDLFAAFVFPLNIIYPLFNAVGSLFVIDFVFRVLKLVDLLVPVSIFGIFKPFYLLITILVFVIVLIVGYIHVFASARPKRVRVKRPTKETNLEWKDVGEEIKEVAYNLASGVKDKLEPKKKAKKKVKKKAKKKR